MNKNKTFCIANWKMNLNQSDSSSFLEKFTAKKTKHNLDNVDVVICPSYPSLSICSIYLSTKTFFLGAQNVYHENKGSFTGEVSVDMLETLDCSFVIVGHSERRLLLNENNEIVKKKFDSIYNSSMTPILCIGESIEDRKDKNYENVLKNQITSILDSYTCINKDIIIAYEPVWAIGTGESASEEIIENTHLIIKNIIKKYMVKNCNIWLLYGGSVNENNCENIISLNNVDGFLIGTSSLDPSHFFNIYKKLGGK